MSTKYPIVALVGRTNVGKSTLFNRIIGRTRAVIEDFPGVTRDRNYALVQRYGIPFTLIDTGGLVGEESTELAEAVRSQSEVAIKDADLVIAIFDGIEGVHPFDSAVVDILRRSGKKVLYVVNKCERPINDLAAAEFYALGIDNFLTISAEHNVSMRQFIEAVNAHLSTLPKVNVPADLAKEIRVAVIGKPNVGKSTLINRILGEDRLITSHIAGTTRDSVDVTLIRDGQPFRIVDTAGLRKKAKVEDGTIERFSNLRALKALADCDIAILVIDAQDGPMEQDAKIAGLAHERGRGLIIVVNKWDAVEKDHQTVKKYEQFVRSQLKFAQYCPILFISALTGRRCPKVLETVKSVYDTMQTRIPTSQINKLLTRAFERKPPPVYRGVSLKLYFATQVDVAPPTFALFLNYPRKMNFSYQRYLKNLIREEYPFEGVDIKFHLRKRGADSEEGEGKQAANG